MAGKSTKHVSSLGENIESKQNIVELLVLYNSNYNW